eukprot:CAMPEP_0206472592 /NCGR_PEP_ID=MMETSP0324_2-20121206/32299_1 /ASSEMBLY_ACC=CAM_ASM_000836 /TAXON_ID=2866 /ORGANISM="Crypthecodinium cohnii, Strain Seligo" /LENGTH=66 /DNA_ID=CAMNT_0053947235 /DNA_START=540 /DNA_END=736 /DNA_ORIENTATION=-
MKHQRRNITLGTINGGANSTGDQEVRASATSAAQVSVEACNKRILTGQGVIKGRVRRIHQISVCVG